MKFTYPDTFAGKNIILSKKLYSIFILKSVYIFWLDVLNDNWGDINVSLTVVFITDVLVYYVYWG